MITDKQRRAQNKAQIQAVDLEYKTKAYIAAYSVLSRMKSEMPNVPRVQELLNEWNEKDEALYRIWNENRKELKHQQRAEAKRARSKLNTDLVRS